MIGGELYSARSTHEVLNQPPPVEDCNLFLQDRVLWETVSTEGADWASDRLTRFGELMGSRRSYELGFQANRNPPVLRTHDRFGNRIDEVDFHPAYHELMKIGVEAEIHCLPWNENRSGAFVARSALLYLMGQIEAGVGCPISMTFAAIPSLRNQPEIASEWEPRLRSVVYDPRFIPAADKNGAMMGMAMTEKQGGSDVRANTTRATPIGAGGPGREYKLVGHKWFCSAPMCDAFLTLAQTGRGLSCFLVPRWHPDGSRNRIFIQRLKDKLGNRSNASGEFEYDGAWARMIGEEGRGVATIIEMVAHTRLDCITQAAAIMRQAVFQAVHHARHRSAFGKLLIEQPLMQNVLADLVVESEASTISMIRVARAYDDGRSSAIARSFARLATAVIKYWVCKRAPGHVYEALECIGGNGYVEESIMPRLYREAPLASIWEGSGNVICLDVLRAANRSPETLPVFFDELDKAAGLDPRLDAHISALHRELSDLGGLESQARVVTEKMALAVQGALLVRLGDAAVAEAFLASRLGGRMHGAYGALPPGTDIQNIIERVRL